MRRTRASLKSGCLFLIFKHVLCCLNIKSASCSPVELVMCHEQDGDFNMFYEVKCSCDDVIRLRKQGAWGGVGGVKGEWRVQGEGEVSGV